MREDPQEHEPGAAIDLSRRKDAILRHSLVEARRVAAPYTTTARIVLARLGSSRLGRVGALILACLALVAIFADLLASDLPVACRWRGSLYILPNVTRPAALAGMDCAHMAETRAPGDWVVAPLVPFGPRQTAPQADALRPPLVPRHPFGTDALGRDVFARVVHGMRTSLVLGVGAATILVAIGVLLGSLAGFAGGLVDAMVTRAIESLTAIPTLILVLVVGALVPSPTTATLLWTIALTRWTELARLVRAEVLSSLGQDYVTAARALGASPVRVLWRHVLPNAIAPAIVAMAFGVSSVVLTEAAVDFLRVGPPDTMASWGESMGEARAHAGAWWLVAFPGLALFVTLLSSSLVGEAARDALDPKLRGREAELARSGTGA
jgi:peptide/nickel transport system permease protein